MIYTVECRALHLLSLRIIMASCPARFSSVYLISLRRMTASYPLCRAMIPQPTLYEPEKNHVITPPFPYNGCTASNLYEAEKMMESQPPGIEYSKCSTRTGLLLRPHYLRHQNCALCPRPTGVQSSERGILVRSRQRRRATDAHHLS